MSVSKEIKVEEREDQYIPALISAESGKVLKLYKDYATEDEPKLSNKDQVYLAWADGEDDVDTLHEIVGKAVKRNTVRGWVRRWPKGRGLPRIAKKS